MIGAIVGDIIGSVHEFKDKKDRDAELFTEDSTFTDDSVLTLATANAILEGSSYEERYGRFFGLYNTRDSASYTGPGIGYGPMFTAWGQTPFNLRKPYGSYGNGSAMRVSPIAWAYDRLEDVMIEAQQSAACTHNHIEGIKGAQAVAVAILMARQGFSAAEIGEFVSEYFHYDLEQNLGHLHESYEFDATAPGSVPQAICCALQAEDFEGAMRNALYIGGDSDTIAAIAGSISEVLHGVPRDFRDKALVILEDQAPHLKGILLEFEKRYGTSVIEAKEPVFSLLSKFRKVFGR